MVISSSLREISQTRDLSGVSRGKLVLPGASPSQAAQPAQCSLSLLWELREVTMTLKGVCCFVCCSRPFQQAPCLLDIPARSLGKIELLFRAVHSKFVQW